jgi:hypothetical protein
MPYLRVGLPTGDEDDGLGSGETQGKFGIAFGTTVDDNWDFILDLGFIGRENTANGFQFGGAVVYKFNKTFSLHAEALFDSTDDSNVKDTTVILGGMVYRPAEYWMIGLYGGSEEGNIDSNTIVGAKIAYWYE